jgi:O-antigen/teichoic acid export membrane protein
MLLSLAPAISFSWAARIAGAIVNLVLLPLVYRNTGPEKFALFLVLNGLFGWVAIGNLGLSAIASRIVAANGAVLDDNVRRRLGRALILPWTILTAALIVSLMFTFSGAFSASIVHSTDAQTIRDARACALIFCCSLYATNVGVFYDGIAIVMNRIITYNAFRLGGYSISLALLFLLDLKDAPLWLFALLSAAMPAVVTLLLIVHTEARFSIVLFVDLREVRFSDLLTHRHLYLLFFITTLSFYIITQFSWTLVGIIRNPQAAAGLAICFRILVFLDSFTWSVNGIIWPWIAAYVASGEVDKGRRLILQSFVCVAAYSIAVSLLFFALGPTVVAIWIGGEDLVAFDLKVIISAFIAVYSLSRFGASILLSFKEENTVSYGCAAEAVAAIAIGSALTIHYGQAGMALGILVGSLLTVGWMYPLRVIRSFRNYTADNQGGREEAKHSDVTVGPFGIK